jgi:hypothetical protein
VCREAVHDPEFTPHLTIEVPRESLQTIVLMDQYGPDQ